MIAAESAAGLCRCGCGEPTPVATRTRSHLGHVKGRPIRFKRGHNVRGYVRSAEHRARLAAAVRGARNPSWKGDAANSTTIHEWLRENFPKTGACEECDAEGPTDWAFLRHPAPHTRGREDYRELCRTCHLRYDEEAGVRPRDANGRWVAA